MELRRRIPRQAAGWSGKYKIESDRRAEWHDCLVIDMSILGVGLALYGAVPTDLVGEQLVVEVDTPIGTSVSIRLVGEVKYVTSVPQGGVRVGLEFVGLSPTERSILNALELMQVAW
ncbi:MAG TPA: PilZ domain-containing protein [Acidimicrobiales bacterium]|nr:PilZ domain-containing protein [Acidimicrobiales bacterium]